jgi:hypothetical protein
MVSVKNMCPVCGFDMDDPPRDYNICPSCGTEFGLHDANAAISELRSAWLSSGPRWWSATDPQPLDWKPLEQVKRVMEPISSGLVLNIGAPSVSGSSMDFIELVPVELPEPAGISHATVHLYTIDR